MATADEVLDEGAAPPGPVPPCGNPTCPFPNQAVRLQPIPEGFPSELVRPGATFFHRKKAACARHFGFQDPPQKPGRKRKDERLPIPVGKRLAGDECPPIIRRIDELWGHRCAACPARLCTPPHRCFARAGWSTFPRCAPRTGASPLINSAILEYLVHGEFAYKESDVNGTFGAWWVPLRKMIKELGKELVEQELELMDSEAKQLRVQVTDNALENSSDDTTTTTIFVV